MKKNIISTVLLLIIISSTLFAKLGMGKWRAHFAYNNVWQITQSDNKVYAVSGDTLGGGLFSVDKTDGGLQFYSKINGLNGANISQIEFDSESQQLLIIYLNGNIDVMSSKGVSNIPDLLNKQMNASKKINHIQFHENRAYLATNFGILVLNMQKKEVADTYFIGSNGSEVTVLNTTILNDSIFALTPTTLYKASIKEKFLVNYEFWEATNQLPGSNKIQSIGSFANKLFLLRGSKMYMRNTTGWEPFVPEIIVKYFNISNNKMLINDGGSSIIIVDKLLNSQTITTTGLISDSEFDAANNNYWLAANELGIVSFTETTSNAPDISYYKPSGPAVNSPWSMTFNKEKLFVVPGGRWAAQYGKPGDIMMFENEVWTNINSKTIQDSTNHPVLDLMNVAVDPYDDKHFFVTSYGTGLYEFKNNKFFEWHTHLNSTLETAVADDPFNYIRVDGAIFDKDGNLWVHNGKINVLKKNVVIENEKWAKISHTEIIKPTLGQILIPNQKPNQKWIPSVRYSPGLCILDDGGTIDNTADDRKRFYSPFVFPETLENNQTVMVEIFPTKVSSIAEDKNAVIWVGTDQGPFLFNNLSNVFDNNYTCSRVKIPRNDNTGNADYLLDDQNIKAIAIDGANRKWIGTETSGVYLMSDNGQETIKHFTASNSPLLSNDILSIAINPVSGEVFFGTSQGIVSYQSDAAPAGDTFTEVHAYPNPVREGYNGLITITGLVANTKVKITDLTGNLICQTISNGSLATWDGKNVQGRKVSTGIYLAICVNPDGTQSTITKIMVIN